MRHLIDTYIRAEDSEKISAFDDLSLIALIVERGADAVDALPEGIKSSKEAVAETIENNVRRLIIDETPINPKYYETMSALLDALVAQRKSAALDYQAYLEQVVALTKQVKNPASSSSYPASLDTPAKRALYDNLGKDDWRNNAVKVRKVKIALKTVLGGDDAQTGQLLELVKNQQEY